MNNLLNIKVKIRLGRKCYWFFESYVRYELLEGFICKVVVNYKWVLFI